MIVNSNLWIKLHLNLKNRVVLNNIVFVINIPVRGASVGCVCVSYSKILFTIVLDHGSNVFQIGENRSMHDNFILFYSTPMPPFIIRWNRTVIIIIAFSLIYLLRRKIFRRQETTVAPEVAPRFGVQQVRLGNETKLSDPVQRWFLRLFSRVFVRIKL